MTKDIEPRMVNENDPEWEVLDPPKIKEPTATTVNVGFKIVADVPVSGHNKWNLDFFRASNNQKITRYSGGWGSQTIEFVVPDELPRDVPLYFKIQYQTALYSKWATSHLFQIVRVNLTPPVITHPGTVWVSNPEIQGAGGVAGATIELYEDGAGTVLFGTAIVQWDGSWRTVLTQPLWMADPFRLTAMQKFNGMESGWASPVLFAVLFRPVITDVTVSTDRKPTIIGTRGLSGATIQILNSGGGGGVLLSTTVESDGSWRVSAPTAWPSGNYLITARQIGKVTGGDSDWAVDKAFTV
jgi:hypothetical protein